MSGPRFYAVRQARTKVIGSRTMTQAEAEREAEVWREHIGAAEAVPATPQARQAVRREDQAALSELLRTGKLARLAAPRRAEAAAGLERGDWHVYQVEA